MANITPEPGGYSQNVYQLETTDPALAGPTGVMNRQAKQLLANDIELMSRVLSAGLRSVASVRAFSSTDPFSFNPQLNASVIYYTGSTDQFHLVNLTGDDDYPEGPTDGIFAAGRIGWVRFAYVGGLVINKPTGMIVWANGASVVAGDAEDTGSTAQIWAVAGSMVDIFIKDNVAIINASLPLTGPAFKIGMMVKWGTVAAVIDTVWWINCDGSAISRSTYSALFEVIGTAYGSGDGSTTFNLPNESGFMIRHRE